jgi:hypothetical protein
MTDLQLIDFQWPKNISKIFEKYLVESNDCVILHHINQPSNNINHGNKNHHRKINVVES